MSAPRIPAVPNDLRPYLNEIAERLYSGHAAVMIGSGFSKNAIRQSPSTPEFPNWSELGDRLYEKLHGKKPDTTTTYLSIPKLAHELEATIGRPALDQLLRDAIPDLDYEPSPLHEKLLDLRWTDVFTTNYDTLLERASRSVTSQRYVVVVNDDDLVYSERPRIIKLHGSFPSDRPYVITDEDYRRYPIDFAPFVNTVRQALLENTLCLIGFSADDPNFLQWIGWIHDNLGRQNAPKIYLVGTLHLTSSQRHLLERRNVMAVDMSAFSDIDPKDHSAALERFFYFLKSKDKDFSTRDWPGDEVSEGPKMNEDWVPQIIERLSSWEVQRRSYPGWIIAPESIRRSLWLATRGWIITPPSTSDVFPRFIDLKFSYELIWRMERCLSPIFDNQIGFLQVTVDRYISAKSGDAPASSSVEVVEQAADQDIRSPSKREVTDMCNHLLLSILRYFREEGELSDWESTRDRLVARIEDMAPGDRARLHYEQSLFALFELNPQGVRHRLDQWPIDDSLPFWEARRAGLLAEIGQVGDALERLESALFTIRQRANLKPVMTDRSLVSEESYVMLILRSVRLSSAVRSGQFEKLQEVSKEFTERWHVLRQYDCDPWSELEAFERSLDRPPVHYAPVTEEPTFDIGRVTRTRHFRGDNLETLTAYQFLRFCEEAAVPFRLPGYTIATKSGAGSVARIGAASPYWAMATLVRIGSEKVVPRIFDRAAMAAMAVATVDLLVARYLDAMDGATAAIGSRIEYWDTNFETLLANVVPEILSRLCCRCSPEVQDRLLDFLVRIYQSDARIQYRGIKHLTERLLVAILIDRRVELIPRLLEFPVLSGLNVIEEHEYVNPFMFIHLWDTTLSGTLTLTVARVRPFIRSALSKDSDERRWATLTLGALYSLGLLSKRTADQFAVALWDQLSGDGLPSGTDYRPHAFLDLPHPPDVIPDDVFRKWMRHQHLPVQRGEKSIRIREPNTLCNAIVGARNSFVWPDDDAYEIIHRLVEWWDADKSRLRPSTTPDSDDSIAAEFVRRFSRLIDALVAVVTPRLKFRNEADMKEAFVRVAGEFAEHGLPALRFEAATLHLFPQKLDNVLRRVEVSLASSSEDSVIDALQAVSVVSERLAPNGPKKDRDILIRILGVVSQMLWWRRETGLQVAIDTVTEVTKRHPWSFQGTIERTILEGLRHLLSDTNIRLARAISLERHREVPDVSTRLILRLAAARLAYTLSKHYSEQATPAPTIIKEWESVCRSDDEFAEIRNQWMEPT